MKELGIRKSFYCGEIAMVALWATEQMAPGAREARGDTSAPRLVEGSREWMHDRCHRIC